MKGRAKQIVKFNLIELERSVKRNIDTIFLHKFWPKIIYGRSCPNNYNRLSIQCVFELRKNFLVHGMNGEHSSD